MQSYAMDAIRNVAVMGHGKAGKTSLLEAMLYNSGCIDRIGTVADGNTVCDFDPDEIRRKASISTAIAPIEWKDMKYNMLDTPGFFDFVGEVKEGLRAADSALITLSGRSGVSVGTEQVFKYARQKDVPIMFFVNKIDDERANYQQTLEQMKEEMWPEEQRFENPHVHYLDMTPDYYDMKMELLYEVQK